MAMYSKEVVDHFQNPRNVGEIENPSGVGEIGNAACGDIMRIYIKVAEVNGEEILEDVKFKTFGCAAAIASSSRMTEMIKGMKLEEALKITNNDIAETLGGLPPAKLHCSNLAADAFQEAVKDYRSKK